MVEVAQVTQSPR